jgi:hypothetical protein
MRVVPYLRNKVLTLNHSLTACSFGNDLTLTLNVIVVAMLAAPTMTVIVAAKLAVEQRGRPDEETIGNKTLKVEIVQHLRELGRWKYARKDV